ncbi:hypothetical protein DBR42_14430, partial [Pelomonas sp. HMWF004]
MRQAFELYAESDVESARIRGAHVHQLVRMAPYLMVSNLMGGLLVWLAAYRVGGVWVTLWLGGLSLLATLGLYRWWRGRHRLATK